MKDNLPRNVLSRKEAVGMEELVPFFLREMHLSKGINDNIYRRLWNEVSGAGEYTQGCFVKGGVLYCRLSSSIVRSHLSYNKDGILREINNLAEKDPLFDKSAGPLSGIVLS